MTLKKVKKVLVGCEYSGRVRDSFSKRGHIAWSCDILPTEIPGDHHEGDIFKFMHQSNSLRWDTMIAHPPCDYLANSGVRWLASEKPKAGFEWSEKYQIYINPDRYRKMKDAAIFFRSLWHSNVDELVLENPIMHKYAMEIIGVKPTQIIQPWQFGHKEMKATCLWIKGLPKLQPTDVVGPPPKNKEERKEWAKIHRMPPGKDRKKKRSLTYYGIAAAMAEQWG